jgi:hypothetical protein
MRFLLSFGAISIALSSPAFASADSFNRFNPPEMSTGDSNMSWSHNWTSADSAQRVLAQLRAVCKSDDRFNRRRCAKGTAILKSAYTELLARRAAQSVVAD